MVELTLGDVYGIADKMLRNRREIYERHGKMSENVIKEEPELKELMLQHLSQFYTIKG